METILQKVAEQNGVSEEEVRFEIQFMIDDLWDHPETDTEQFKMLREELGHKPSPEEFIRYCTDLIREAGRTH